MKNQFLSIWLKFSLFLFILIGGTNHLFAQCTVTSSNGWTAKFTVTPIAVLPEFTNCPWYYHYEVKYALKVEFSGSSSYRSISCNLYFNCTGGTGNQPYKSGGTFTANSNTILQTNNNARQYTALSSYNYGSNPNCNQVTLAHVNCATVRIDYWGNGVTNGSITCNVGTPLPISLLHFGAEKKDQLVNLNWITASETNNDFFTIERSTNGERFDVIETIKGAGNSVNQIAYNYNDKNAPQGIVYYRLKQTDFNGDYSYSKTVAIRNTLSNNNVSIIPNPGSDFPTLNYVSTDDKTASLKISDSKGEIVKELQIESKKGTNILTLDLSEIKPGIYLFNLMNESNLIFTSKFVKL